MRTNLAQRVLHAIQTRKMLRAGDRVGVAVSGGADSVALLLLLLELRKKLGIVLSVVHFNHQLRGKASDADEEFVARLAATHGLPFHTGREEIAALARRKKANLEDTARRSRYEFFARLVEDDQVSKVVVAHTADDQAETVLAHMLRGTGLAGLAGIYTETGAIVRPLLGTRRAELRAYLKSCRQPWREDATNRDIARMRARIRKKLLPFLEKEFQPGVVDHLGTLSELAREDEALLQMLTERRASAILQKEVDTARVSIKHLVALPAEGTCDKPKPGTTAQERHAIRAMSKRLVRHAIEGLKTHGGQLNASHVEKVLELAEQGASGACVQVPGGVEVRRERDTLAFRAVDDNRRERPTAKSFEYPVDLGGIPVVVAVPNLGCVFRFTEIDWLAKREETIGTGPVLDRDRLRTPIALRSWRPGDRLQLPGHRGARKLKRLLNEKRISRWERDGWPVLTSGGVLAWARGFPVAAEFAASERTRAAIVIAQEPLS